MNFNYGIPYGKEIGNMFSSFFHPEAAYNKAANEMQKYYNQAQGYFNPYNQAGQGALQNLQGAQNALMNPEELFKRFASSYETSPYAKQLMEEAKGTGMQSASEQGLLGSSAALQNVTQGAESIKNAERNAYMKDLMDKYMQGANINQNIYGIGANAANQQGTLAFNQGQRMGEMRYGQQAAPGNLLERLLGLGIGGAATYYGGRGV